MSAEHRPAHQRGKPRTNAGKMAALAAPRYCTVRIGIDGSAPANTPCTQTSWWRRRTIYMREPLYPFRREIEGHVGGESETPAAVVARMGSGRNLRMTTESLLRPHGTGRDEQRISDAGLGPASESEDTPESVSKPAITMPMPSSLRCVSGSEKIRGEIVPTTSLSLRRGHGTDGRRQPNAKISSPKSGPASKATASQRRDCPVSTFASERIIEENGHGQ